MRPNNNKESPQDPNGNVAKSRLTCGVSHAQLTLSAGVYCIRMCGMEEQGKLPHQSQLLKVTMAYAPGSRSNVLWTTVHCSKARSLYVTYFPLVWQFSTECKPTNLQIFNLNSIYRTTGRSWPKGNPEMASILNIESFCGSHWPYIDP